MHTYTVHTVYVYVLSWLPRNLWFEVCRFSLVVVCSLVAAYGLCFWILVPSDWVKSLSRVRLFATPWTVAYQAPPSMGFSRQEYWSGLPFPSPGDLPNLGIKPGSPALHSDAFNLWATREAQEQGSNPGPCPGRWILNHWTTREFPTIFNFIHGLLHNYDSVSESCSVVSYSLQLTHGLFSSWNSPGHNTRVDTLSLFQGIFPTQESNPGLLHCRRILYQLSHKGSPMTL